MFTSSLNDQNKCDRCPLGVDPVSVVSQRANNASQWDVCDLNRKAGKTCLNAISCWHNTICYLNPGQRLPFKKASLNVTEKIPLKCGRSVDQSK